MDIFGTAGGHSFSQDMISPGLGGENFNFDWQMAYRWAPGAKKLPRGTRLECIAHYDNSAFNPYNPNPFATVRHGPQTHHEMMFGFFFYTNAAEQLGHRSAAVQRRQQPL